MHLSPKEIDKLVLHNAGFVAQKRYARGLKLNYPETIALISTQLLEFIRDGKTVASLMDLGKQILGEADVMESVSGMIHEVQVEGTFPDGTKLVTVHQPICSETGNSDLALYGSGLKKSAEPYSPDNVIQSSPGEIFAEKGELEINPKRELIKLKVTNKGDRPIQVGSHYPFFETNPELEFDRKASFGYRLNIPSGMAIRFEPGDSKTVELVKLAGAQKIMGGNGLVSGEATPENLEAAFAKSQELGFANKTSEASEGVK